MSKATEPWSLTSLREKLIKIGAKVVSHGRYVTFQLAEVAVSRQIFADILSLIARLRAPPAPHERPAGAECGKWRHDRYASVCANQSNSAFGCPRPPASSARCRCRARFADAQAAHRPNPGLEAAGIWRMSDSRPPAADVQWLGGLELERRSIKKLW